MAHIFKNPNKTNKGIISFTHNEWNFFFSNPDIHPVLEGLKEYFYLGYNAACFHGKTPLHPIVDFVFSSPSLIEATNEHTINIPWLDRNFLPPEFKEFNKGERFYDIITVSRAVNFKHVPELIHALRKLFDKGKYYKTLLVIPTPENEGDGSFATNLPELIKENFNYEERKYVSLCKLAPELGFLGMSQQSISFLYNHSKVVYKGSESEGTCRALHEGIVCGCVAVYYKNHKGALVDYLTEKNSVGFKTYNIDEIANCLENAVENFETLKPDTNYLFDELGDANIKDKLIPWFSKLYEREGVEFDRELINLDNLHNRLCGHYLEDPWKHPDPTQPTTAIKTNEQLNKFIEFINTQSYE